LLESVVNRYHIDSGGGFRVGDVVIDGDVEILGENGVVTEVVNVNFANETDKIKPALVIRLDRDVEVMGSPIAKCDRPVESGFFPDVVTSINGIFPDTNGTIYFDFESAYDYLYDANGNVEFYSDGTPKFSTTTPLLTMVAGPLGTMVFEDHYDYRKGCFNKNRKTSITYINRKCKGCEMSAECDDKGNAGYGAADGVPIIMVGAAIWNKYLCIYWSYACKGEPTWGSMPLDISVLGSAGEQTRVKVNGVKWIRGYPPALPGDLVEGSIYTDVPGTTGSPIYSVYQLSQGVADATDFKIHVAEKVVANNPPQESDGRYYNIPSFTCVLTSRNPLADPSKEFKP
jgi:hypothetical protein